MDLAEAVTQPDQRTSRPERSIRGIIAPAVGLVAICLMGGLGWWASRPTAADQARAAAARGRSDLRNGRPDLAFQAVSQVRDDSPEAGEAMTVAGLALIRLGQHRVARMALERALKLKPDQFEAAVTLGELNLDLGNAHRGAEWLGVAARLRPREFGVWRLLGRARGDSNDYAGAVEAYRKALELRPMDRETVIELIALSLGTGQPNAADPWIDQAVRQHPDDPVILGQAARGAFDAHRIDEALALSDRALVRDPRNPDASLARALSLVARSRWREALAAAERAVAEAPNDSGPLQLLWIAESRLGLTERAAATLARRDRVQKRAKLMDELTEQLKAHPDDPGTRWKMGQVAVEAGSFLYAQRCFEAALALDPDYQPARESLAALKAAHPELSRDGAASAFRPRRRGSSMVP